MCIQNIGLIGMYKKEIESIPNFCVVPFMNLNIDADGSTMLCCVQDANNLKTQSYHDYDNLEGLFNNAGFAKIRQEFLSNHQPTSCSTCFKLENSGVVSERQSRNQRYLQDTGIQVKEHSKHLPNSLDLRPSNRCNLKCRMCTPSASSSIAKEKFMPNHIISLPSKNIIDSLDNIVDIKLLGGEPTMMPEVMEILQSLINKKKNDTVQLHITTNGTTNNKQWHQLIGQFKQVTFQFSIDSIEQTNNYIRSGSKYSNILENIKYVQHLGKDKNWKYDISQTLQIYNLHDYYLLEDDFIRHGVNISEICCTQVRWPDHLNIEYLPVTVKNSFKSEQHNDLVSSLLDTEMPEEIVYAKMLDFVEQTNYYDMIRNTKFSDINPKLWDMVIEFISNNYTKYGASYKC